MQADNSAHTTVTIGPARRRVLVLVSHPFPGHDQPAARRILAAVQNAEVLVVAPTLPIRGERWLIDLNARERQASANLQSWTDALADPVESVHGEIGDESPGNAVTDALGDFAADDLVTSLIAAAPLAGTAQTDRAA